MYVLKMYLIIKHFIKLQIKINMQSIITQKYIHAVLVSSELSPQ